MKALNHTRHFYVGTYTSAQEQGLFQCTLHTESGEMQLVSGIDGIENPSYLAVSPDWKNLYAVSEKEVGEVFSYMIDPETKDLHVQDRQLSEGSSPCFVQQTPNGKMLLAANYGGCVSAFAIRERGVLEHTSRVRHTGSGPHPERQTEPHPHSFVPAPDGVYLFAPDLGIDRIVRYTIEDERLFSQGEIELPPGTGPRTLAFHPSGKWAYLSGELNNTVTVLDYEATSGCMKPVQHESLLPAEQASDPANAAAHTAVSPCGGYVYVSNRGHDSISQFAVDPTDGRLTFVERVSSGGKVPRHFAITDGFLLAAHQESNSLVSFAVGEKDGRLTPTGFSLELNRPVCVCPLPGTENGAN